jgi:hypothetical protein
LRRQLGSAAQEKMKRFSWTRFATRHEAVFNRATGLSLMVLSDEVLRINAKLEDKTRRADVNVRI